MDRPSLWVKMIANTNRIHIQHRRRRLQGKKNQFEKEFSVGFDVLVDQHFPVVSQDADIHFPGVQIDAAMILVLGFVKFHDVSPFASVTG